jgi:hypothetical protein
MPFVLLIVGLTLLVASVRNTQGDLFDLVQKDFTGQNNFIFWLVSILVIGAVGYIPRLKPLSTAFLTLVVIVLFLSKGNPKLKGGGFFAQATAGLGSTTAVEVKNDAATASPVPVVQGPTIDLSLPENMFTIH